MKKFYYNTETYTETYTRRGTWKRIDYTNPRNEETESRPYFRHENKRYYIDDFMRTNYPAGEYTEIKAADGEKATLHAYKTDVYYKPYFIELNETGEAVRVYQYEGSETK